MTVILDTNSVRGYINSFSVDLNPLFVEKKPRLRADSGLRDMTAYFCWKCVGKHARPCGDTCRLSEDLGLEPPLKHIPEVYVEGGKLVRKFPDGYQPNILFLEVTRAAEERPEESQEKVIMEESAVKTLMDQTLETMREEMRKLREDLEKKPTPKKSPTKSTSKVVTPKRKKKASKAKSRDTGTDTEAADELLMLGMLRGRTSEDDSEDWVDEEVEDESTGNESSPDTKKKRRRPKHSRGRKLKNVCGRDLTIENCQGHHTPWPQFYVFDFIEGKGAHYDDLTVQEFVYGFVQMIIDPQWADDSKYLLRYLARFLEDVKDKPNDWEELRKLHAMIATLIEKKAIKWSSRTAIDRLKARFFNSRGDSTVNRESTISDEDRKPCIAWNMDKCGKGGSHTGVVHKCSRCHRMGIVRRHKAINCDEPTPSNKKGGF